jgi:hypothetical protein
MSDLPLPADLPTDHLKKLLTHDSWDVRHAVATHPLVNIEIMALLAHEFPVEIAHNPAAQIHLLSRNYLDDNLDDDDLAFPDLFYQGCPDWLRWMVPHLSVELHRDLGSRPWLDRQIRLSLTSSTENNVIEALARDLYHPEILYALMRAPTEETYTSVIYNHRCPDDLFERVYKEAHASAGRRMAGSPFVPVSRLCTWLDKTLTEIEQDASLFPLLSRFAENPRLPTSEIERLFHSRWIDHQITINSYQMSLSRSLCRNRSTPAPILRKLAQDPSHHESLRHNYHLPADLIAELYPLAAPENAYEFIPKRDCPPRLTSYDRRRDDDEASAILHHLWLDPPSHPMFQHLRDVEYTWIAHNPHLTPEWIALLVERHDLRIDLALVGNPVVPQSVADSLNARIMPQSLPHRLHSIEDFCTIRPWSKEIFDTLFQMLMSELRPVDHPYGQYTRVPSHPSFARDHLEIMLAHPNYAIRAAAIRSALLTPDDRQHLAQDRHPYVRWLATLDSSLIF